MTDRDAPEWDADTHCFYCNAAPAAFVRALDEQKLRVGDEGSTLGSALFTCGRCETMFVAAEDEKLLALQVRARSADNVRQLRPGRQRDIVRVLRGAAGRPHRLRHYVEDTAVAHARRDGFEPLEDYTGVTDTLGPLWPPDHSRGLPDLRPRPWEDIRWFVRSPWPALTVQQVMFIIWPFVQRDRASLDPAVSDQRIVEFFGWDERQAVRAWDDRDR